MRLRRTPWISDDSGQGLAEYVVILALASLGIVFALLLLRNSIGTTMHGTTSQIQAATSGHGGAADPGGGAGGAGTGGITGGVGSVGGGHTSGGVDNQGPGGGGGGGGGSGEPGSAKPGDPITSNDSLK